MKRKDKVLIGIGAIAIISLCFLVYAITFIGIGGNTTYTFKLPLLEHVKYIKIEQENHTKEIYSTKELASFFRLLENVPDTKIESISDTPVNVKNKINIHFYTEEESMTLFLYKKKKKYYLEQPYNGIYKITKEEYEKIESML